MIEELEVVLKMTRKFQHGSEVLLHQPQVQARHPLAAEVRGYLIRHLFYADRVITSIIDGNDYHEYWDVMNANWDTAHRKLGDLQRSKV